MDPDTGANLDWEPVSLDAIAAARVRTADVALRTPLVRLDADDVVPGGTEIWLKLECLQPVRSFKLRGAANALARLTETGPAALAGGVWTVSSGNMAQALAYAARARAVPCTVYVPETVPRAKLAHVLRYGGEAVAVSAAEFGAICLSGRKDGAAGRFVHPYSDPDMMAGAGVIGLELLEDLPEVDAVVVPWGGGGLACGVASALRALRPGTRVYASEVDTSAPLAASLVAGSPVSVPFTPSFVDGIGAPFIGAEMFALARRLVDGAIVVDRAATAAALRLVVERTGVIPEGAAATAVAAALSGRAGTGRIACVLSGGNVEARTLATILNGDMPA